MIRNKDVVVVLASIDLSLVEYCMLLFPEAALNSPLCKSMHIYVDTPEQNAC
jgi:hypothetical protein